MTRLGILAFIVGSSLLGCANVAPAPAEIPAEPEISEQAVTRSEHTEPERSIEPSAQPLDDSSIPIADLIPETSYQVSAPQTRATEETGYSIEDLCREIGNKLGSVDKADCDRQELQATEGTSVEGRTLAIRDYLPIENRAPLGRVLVIGGIHGDEFSSVSVVFKWMDILDEHHSGLFHWRFVPASNPDGLLSKNSQRQNANGVDLNRNFPTADWTALAQKHWTDRAFKHPRRYPGESPNSEPETRWIVDQIDAFKPDVILSMHAPYHLVDYDGPPSAPNQLGSLYLRKLGVFPGSLGNYAGVDLNLPIVTVELASAGSMPSSREISDMWTDLVAWLRTKLSEQP